jgi:hypothetical protein
MHDFKHPKKPEDPASVTHEDRVAYVRQATLNVETGTSYRNADGTMPKPPVASRKNSHGGWRGSPASLVALARHRKATQFGGSKRVACRKCKNPVVTGLAVCFAHGGKRIARQRTTEKGLKYHYRAPYARNSMFKMLRAEILPRELVLNKTFLRCADLLAELHPDTAERKRRVVLPKTAQELILAVAVVGILWEMVHAWMDMEAGGGNAAWIAAYTKAAKIGLGRGE